MFFIKYRVSLIRYFGKFANWLEEICNWDVLFLATATQWLKQSSPRCVRLGLLAFRFSGPTSTFDPPVVLHLAPFRDWEGEGLIDRSLLFPFPSPSPLTSHRSQWLIDYLHLLIWNHTNLVILHLFYICIASLLFGGRFAYLL